MRNARNKENLPPNQSNLLGDRAKHSDKKIKCKRKLSFPNRKIELVMAPVANCRDSVSFDAILDNTNPEKLVQLILEKRGLQNDKRIFSDISTAKESNRKSFPFEVLTNNKVTIINQEVIKPIDENSLNASNKVAESQNINDETNKNFEEERKRFSQCRVPLKKANNLGRRILLKTFEKIQNEDGFHPTVASTPVHRNAPDEEFGSIISNINRCSGDETSPNTAATNNTQENIVQEPTKQCDKGAGQKRKNGNISNQLHNGQHSYTSVNRKDPAGDDMPDESQTTNHNQKAHRKTDTIKQAKTITESLISQSPIAPKENLNQDQNNRSRRNTQMFHESIEMDETIVGNNSSEHALGQENDHNRNSEAAQTFVNCAQDEEAQEHPLPELQAVSSTTPSLPTSSRVQFHVSNTQRHVNEFRASAPKPQSVPNCSPHINRNQSREALINSASRRNAAGLVSAIANRIRNSQNSILAPASPLRTERSPRKSHGESFSIPQTQSPQVQVNCPKSPVIVMPIYPPTTCHQTHSKLPEPNVDHALNVSQRNTAQLKPRSKIPERSSSNQHRSSRTSDNRSHRICVNQNSLKRKKSSIKRRTSPTRRPESPEITSDEDNIDGRPQNQTVNNNNNNNNSDIHSGSRLSKGQSGVIDVRIPARRSNNKKLSLKNTLLHSILNNTHNASNNDRSPTDSDVSFENVLKIDELLKRLNNSPQSNESVDDAGNIQRSPSNSRVRSLQNEQTFEDIDENIIEPMQREDVGNGYVYDISPRLGKIYMDSMIKNGRIRESSADPRRRIRPKSIKSIRPSQAVTYGDLEASMRRLIRSKQSTSNYRQSRRKLYSKGNSDAEYSSEDATQLFESQTHINETSTMPRLYMIDKKSKNAKCRVNPEPVKLLTIDDLKQLWRQSAEVQPSKRTKRPKDVAKILMSDDDELLFKVPQAMPIKRKIPRPNPTKVHIASNIKTVLGLVHTSPINQLQAAGNNGNSSSDESAEAANFTDRNLETPVDILMDTNSSHIGRNSHHAINVSQAQNTSQRSCTLANAHPNGSRGDIGGEKLLAVNEVSAIPANDCNEIEDELEHPVEPDHTSTSQRMSKSKKQSSMPSKKQSKANEPQSEKKRQAKVNQSKGKRKTLNESINQRERTKSNGTVHEKSRISSSRNSEVNEQMDHQSSKQPERDVEVTVAPLRKDQLEGNSLVRDHQCELQPTKNKSQKKRSTTNKKSKQTVDTEEVSTVGPVRRSARKHRAPRPYWTSRYTDDEQPEISYRDYFTKKRSKHTTRLESVSEAPPEPPVESEASQQLVENLFDVIKEISAINTPAISEHDENPGSQPPQAWQPPKKRSRKLRKTPKKVNKNVTTGSHNPANTVDERMLTDSGHGTDSNVDQNQQKGNVILSWLKDLVTPQTISSNPDLVKIFHMSDVSIVPVSNLVFHALDGVEYAYYSSTQNGENYGYLRFHPNSTKKSAKTKQFELRLLSVVGQLTLYIEKEEGILRNGDFVSVPKGIRYSIANHSDEIALLFFIKK